MAIYSAYVVLVKDNRPLRVESNCKERRKHIPARRSKFLWILGQRQSMPANNHEEQVILRIGSLLEFDPIRERTEVVA